MRMISHRGNLSGPDHQTENTLRQIRVAFAAGCGIETDIRRDGSGQLYISHDPNCVTADNDAERHAREWSQHSRCEIALNVKELGYEHELIDFIERHGLWKQCFLFDFELRETNPGATAAMIRQRDQRIRVAVRVSDRYGESVERAGNATFASVVWLDEFDSLWVTDETVSALKQHDRLVYAISPEIHGFSMAATETRWKQFQAWGVDGICTDFPLRATAILGLAE